ncbi:rhomboid family intramembrane serine protease [Methylococcus sp. EFPC2]|uniref:rhomboid family intramembrane serine protease n=1 Tax=Methylococcus sp. EFPC2 TaxID=2812648 RepID=UPI0019677032|nr:rhomboid family intramembrane serine protease [Methylococcus sp. EFPC2]QSA98661.1 rhomboid family intramembrane serine protease [Methylococcus sp. EFPC2]
MIPYRDTVPLRYTPWVTWTLIAVNFALFVLVDFLPERTQVHVTYLYGLVPARYGYPGWAAWFGLSPDDYTPLVTHMFLHSNWLHVTLNMWLLWIFGDNIEDRMGGIRFLAFYLLCGVAGAGLQIFANAHSTTPLIGASAAIAGILGAYFFLLPNARIVIWVFMLPIFFQVPAIAFLGIWVMFQLYKITTGLSSGAAFTDVAWWGHLGGFIAGALIHRGFLSADRAASFSGRERHAP